MVRGLGGLVLFGTAGAHANDLYFTMPVNYDQGEIDTLFVYGAAGISGTVSSPSGFATGYTVGSNGVTSVTIPSTYDLTASGTVTSNGFQVTTSNPSQNVGASYLSREGATTDTTYLLNSTALGTSYYAVGSSELDGYGTPYPSQLSIVGTQAGTTVTITPSVAFNGGYAAGVPFTVTLGAGQAVMYTGQDVTGTKVVSTAPIAVFGGGQCSQVPNGTAACDHTITALPSTDNYTTQAVIPTTVGVETPSSNIVRVLAATNGTVVTYQGVTIASLSAGGFYDFRSGAGGVLTSNNPVLINEYLTGQSEHSGTPGDPAISFVPGTSQWLSEYLLSTPVGDQAYENNFLDLAIQDADIPSLTLNGASVPGASCTALSGTSYSTCNIAIGAGVYDVKAGNPFLALVDGGTDYDSYLTFVGTTFSAGASPVAEISTTGGDVSPGVYSLSSPAANSSTVVFDGGTLQILGGSFPGNIIPNPVTIDSNSGTIDTSTGNGGFSGVVSGPGSLTINGGGTFALTGANTYEGGTTVNGSTVAVGGASPLGTGALALNHANVEAVADATIANAVTITDAATIDSQAYALRMTGAISGSGSITKTGTGVLALTGSNSYSGGTTLQTGTLAIGSATALGSGALTMQNGTILAAIAGGLDVANAIAINGSSIIQSGSAGSAVPPYSGGLHLDGVISGTGTLIKTGPTGLRLVGANTYSGGTIIENGHIGVANNQSLGTGTVTFDGGFLVAHLDNLTISNAAVLAQTGMIDTNGHTFTYAGPISGAGALVKSGLGTLSLSGGNTYSGGTLVSAGTLVAGSATGISPNGPVSVAGGATLDVAGYALTTSGLSGSGTITNSGSTPVVIALTVAGGSASGFEGMLVDGTGGIAIEKTGAGTQLLAGASSYSGGTNLLQGTLAVGNNAALGSGLLSMADGTTLAFAVSGIVLPNAIDMPGSDPTIDTGPYNDTVAGTISGPGALTKLGTGTLTLTGINTYTGATDVAQGTLLVNGSTAASFTTVESGAAIGGSGTIGGLNLLGGATLAPGAGTPFSTLTINGNATLQPGSTYAVSINATGQSDRTLVGGAAVISGAGLAVNAVGSGFTPSSRVGILSATGGLTGTFSTVSARGFAFLTPTLSYSPTDVTLGFTQSAPLASAALTPNQTGAATGIDSLGPGNPLYDAVIGQNAAGARQAFQSASAETHASASQTAVNAGRVTSSIIFDRLWNLPVPQAGDALDALSQFAPGTPALLNCYAPTTAPATGVQQGQGYSVWGQAIGDFGHSTSDGNAPGVDRTLGGFVLGLDSRVDAKAFENWRVGVAGGYTNTQFDVKQGGGSGTFENAFGTLYAGARYGAVTLRFAGTYGGTQTNLSRAVAFPSFLESERSNNGGDTGSVSGEVGYRFQYSQAVIEPIFNGAYTHVHQDGYREKGGAAALVGAPQDIDVESTVLGFRGEALPIATLPVVARIFLGWQHSYGDINPAATVAFASGGLSFSSYGVPIDRNAVVAEAGLDYRATTALSLGITYFGQAGERNTDSAIKGRVEYRF